MRILIALALITLVAPTAIAQIPDCEDYAGVPRPVSSAPCDDVYRSLVAVGDDLCAISSNYDLQGWRVEPGGLPQLGGILEPTHGHSYSQLAVHGDRVYAAVGEFGVMIHEMIDATPVPADSILVTRTSRLVAVVERGPAEGGAFRLGGDVRHRAAHVSAAQETALP